MIKLPDFCSIYTAKVLAISHALEIVEQQKIDQALILSDSLSALNSILNIKQSNTISRITQNQSSLLNSNNQIATLLWIPSHIGIPGNETADIYAKRAITSPDAISVQACSLSDIKVVIQIQSLIPQKWQDRWSSSQTKLSTNPWLTYLTKRRHEVVINRLKIEHTWLIYRHLMRRKDPDPCTTCGEALSNISSYTVETTQTPEQP